MWYERVRYALCGIMTFNAFCSLVLMVSGQGSHTIAYYLTSIAADLLFSIVMYNDYCDFDSLFKGDTKCS